MIQGISKYLVPTLLELLYPKVSLLLPRLNSLLIPIVETLAEDKDVTTLYVAPIGKQGRLLESHYGFKKVDKRARIERACGLISWFTEVDFYYKELQQKQP